MIKESDIKIGRTYSFKTSKRAVDLKIIGDVPRDEWLILDQPMVLCENASGKRIGMKTKVWISWIVNNAVSFRD